MAADIENDFFPILILPVWVITFINLITGVWVKFCSGCSLQILLSNEIWSYNKCEAHEKYEASDVLLFGLCQQAWMSSFNC